MAYIYVKSGGTATGTAGKYADAKTGSWSTAFTDPSQYYGSINDADNLSSFVEGDVFFVSNLHSTSVNVSPVVLGIHDRDNTLVCVDDNDLLQLSTGAKEFYTNFTGEFSLTIYFSYVYGISFEVQSDSKITIFRTGAGVYEKCEFIHFGNSTTQKYLNLYGLHIFFSDCTFNFGTDVFNYIPLISNEGNSSTSVYFRNCRFIAPEDSVSALFKFSYSFGLMEFDGCDFSQANRPIVDSHVSSNPLLTVIGSFHIIRCKEASNTRNNILYSDFIFPSGYYYSGNTKYLSTQYYPLGIVDSDTSVYRNDGAEYISGEYFSYKVTSDIGLVYVNPFTFKLADFYLDTSTTKTFTVELLQENGSTPLTDYQFSIDVYHIKSDSFKATRESTTKILPSTNDLSTSSKTWTGLTDPVKQYISLTTSETGQYGLCSVYVNIFVPNRTIYICPKIDIT